MTSSNIEWITISLTERHWFMMIVNGRLITIPWRMDHQKITYNCKQPSWTSRLGKDVKKIGNWRSITIGNLSMRLYTKIWDKRLRAIIILDERQKDFVPVHGCFQNVKILQQVIKQQRRRKKEYNILFLDLAKAFNTISHKAIEKGLIRKGVPMRLLRAF